MEVGAIESILAFPTHIYTIEKTEFISQVRSVAMDFMPPDQKLDEIYPVRMSSPMQDDPRIQPFAEYVAVTAGNILADQGYSTDGTGAVFESMWCQEHYKHSGMDQHTHPGVLIVGFYFLDVPPKSSAMTFFDPRPGKVAFGAGESNASEITYASNSFHFAPRPGLLVFANSWLPHAFTRHADEQPLRFIHFNIDLVKHKFEHIVEVI
jgi:uncharacterized protein (TIGR02466 family)